LDIFIQKVIQFGLFLLFAPTLVSDEQSESTPGIVELARECDEPHGPHEPDLLPVSSLIALIELESKS